MVVLKISLPVILIDEFLKWFARNYVEVGDGTAEVGKKNN